MIPTQTGANNIKGLRRCSNLCRSILTASNIWLETSNQYEVQILKKVLMTVSEDKVLFGSMYPERFTRCSLDVFDMLRPKEEWKKAWLGGNAERLFAKHMD